MKLLAVHSIYEGNKHPSAIDYWRIYRPIEELKKRTDWQIDTQPSFIPGIESYTSPEDLTSEELEHIAKKLGSYDIIYSSYQPSPFVFALLMIVEKRYGTKYVLDDDDDVYNIEPDNPFWLTSTQEDVYSMQRMIELAGNVITTTERLAARYKEKATGKVHVVPNYISNDFKKHSKVPNDRVDIVYFGGAGHYSDFHDTGVAEALQKLMHEHKNVHFKSIGVPIDLYLPTKRRSEVSSSNVIDYVKTVYPAIEADIAIAPLRDTEFSLGKSNIKWQEATRMGAALVCSDVGPYALLPVGSAIKAENTAQSWYEALSEAIDAKKRQQVITAAEKELETNWTLEKQWTALRDVLKAIANE